MRIMLATDGSEYSEQAARFLSRLALTPDDEVVVLHVISDVPLKDDRASYYESLRHIRQEIAPRILDTAVDILKPLKAKISTALVDGYPDKAIIDLASDSYTDLVVMGARGLKGIKSLIVGSVTRAVAVASPKPVIVIKPSMAGVSETMKILFAADGSPHAYETARLLASMPLPYDSELVVLNVIWSAMSDLPERYAQEVDERIKARVAAVREAEFSESERIIEHVRKTVSRGFGSIKLMSKVGEPSLEILNAAEMLGPHIIAVGCRGIRGVRGMMGSVSRNILLHSTSSVFIGKAG